MFKSALSIDSYKASRLFNSFLIFLIFSFSFFLSSEEYFIANKSMQSLVTDNGQLVSEFKEVLNEQLNLYSSLYCSRETVEIWDSELVD
jgi:hypothetical protein